MSDVDQDAHPVAAAAASKHRPKGIEWDAQPLGLEPDHAIARKLGVATSVVWGARARRGIEPAPVGRARSANAEQRAWIQWRAHDAAARGIKMSASQLALEYERRYGVEVSRWLVWRAARKTARHEDEPEGGASEGGALDAGV